MHFRGPHPSRRHSSVRLHSGDSLGTGAACAASVAAHAHRMPCRLSGRPSKAHSSLRPQNCLRLLGAKRGTRRRRHEAEQARTAGHGRRRRDGCEALEGCIQPQADRAVSGERMTRLTPDGRAVAGGAPQQRTKQAQTLTECAGRGMPPPLAEPASRGGLHGDGRDPERNLVIAERGADAARRPYAMAGEVAAAFPAY